jgi:DNA-binding transcriptional MerR regulator
MSSAAPDRSLMSIGEVLAAVRREFPDVTISKIRFLESEGLVEPARTPSGYRKFSHHDVERLRYVLAAQRDQYLPLRVIKEHLDAIDRGLDPPAAPDTRPRVPEGILAGTQAAGVRAFQGEASEIRLSRSELIQAAGIDDELLEQLEGFGLVGPRAGTAHYDADALVVAKTVAEMRDYGLEPRHLRAFRTGAEREAGLVEQVVSPLLRQRDAEANARAEEVAREMGALSVQLHTALVRSALRSIVQR